MIPGIAGARDTPSLDARSKPRSCSLLLTRSSSTTRASRSPLAAVGGGCARRVRARGGARRTAARGCSTGCFMTTRIRIAGSCAPAGTRATGSSSSSGSPLAGGRSRRSTRSTRAPSGAGSDRSRSAAGARWCSPRTARTRPTCGRGRGTGCGPTPTTRPTGAAWSPPRGWSSSRPAPLRGCGARRPGAAPAAAGTSRPSRTRRLGPFFQPGRWDAVAFAASAGSAAGRRAIRWASATGARRR